MKRTYLLLSMFLLCAFGVTAQEWVVPAENNAKLSTAAFSDSTRKAGGELYLTNCKSCHGDPGKNNAVKLVPPPPDPASAQLQKNTDGALLYKITEGRGPMPSFKNTLSASAIWNIISFLRGFNDKYVQEIAKKPAAGATFEQARLNLSWDQGSGQVRALLTAVKEKVRQPVPGAEVKLYAKRYFGNLPIDEPRTTDQQGIALFRFPRSLPGDSTGRIQLLAKPSDEAAFGEMKADTTLAIGVPTYRPPLNQPRALWNVVTKTPVWLLLSYSFTVLAVWGFILYVLLQVRQIYQKGGKKEIK